jgi:amino acid adenylation domain-containing protein/thioester reductase-like protein
MNAELFVDAFAAVVREHPGARALEDARSAYTYAELDRAARGLAGALAREGIRSGDLVGIGIEKSADTVVAILASWMLGAAWVPIDPGWPEARRRFVAREAGVRAVIGADVEPRAREAPAALPVRTPRDLAYVIYTSGSTGRPKGVRIAHAGLVPVLRAQIDAFALAPGKRCLLVLATTFDAAISDIGTALLAGATLIVPDGPSSPSRVRTWLEEHRITHVDLPPSFLPCIHPPPCLETVVIGGEPAPPDAVRAWAERVRVVNVYGPTEATICTSLCVCDASWSRPLLGAPIAGARYRVVDGELFIESPGVALGYVARPELEAARFVLQGGVRAFRTGDRVLAHRDGALEWVGRVDRQIKLRGVLVAPEEIEACLAAHPAVARAAVALENGELTAFVARAGASVSARALKEHVAAALPRALWPGRIAVLGALPETASCKIDYASLGAHAPVGPDEVALARIWRTALGVARVGRHDDFFALGGTSMTLLEVVAAAEGAGIALSPEALYRTPTIAALAKAPVSEHACSTELLRADAERAMPSTRALAVRGAGAVLVTGATGALGRRVVRELAGREVRCLVRREAAVSGARLVVGDVAKPRFGLSVAEWERLRAEVSDVYHLAANVHFALPYERLHDTNVKGTAHVLAFARGKRLHLASTLSVGACAEPQRGRFMESDRLEAHARVFGGYAQSKWAAEHLAARAGEGEAWTTYRLGLLVGEERSQLFSFVRGVARLGVLPRAAIDASERLRFDVTPADWAARALVALSHGPEGARVYHLCGPRPVSLAELLDAMRAAGVEIAPVPADEFCARALALPSGEVEATALLSLCRRALATGSRHAMRDLFLATESTFDASEALSALPDGLACPRADRPLVERYVALALEGARS